MKSNLVKFVGALLAVVLAAAPLSACSKGESEESTAQSTTTAGTGTAGETETTDPVQTALDQIGKLDYGGGDFTILFAEDIAGYDEEVLGREKDGDDDAISAINEKVYERNTLFEERCHLNFTPVASPVALINSKVQNEVKTEAGDYQLVSMPTDLTAQMALSGLLYNYNDLEIDYTQPWWDQSALDFALAGRVFFMHGAFDIVDDDVTFCMMFNKDLAAKYKTGNLYDRVRNNEWTMEYFNEVIQRVSADNGDGTWDEADTYGFVTPNSVGPVFFYGAGLRYVNNTPDMERPELIMKDGMVERAVNVLELVNRIVYENHSTYKAQAGKERENQTIFVESRALFYSEAVSYMRRLSHMMEDDYGVLTIPKYDTAQEQYTTFTHGIGSCLSIPTTVAKGDTQLFADVLATYAALSERYVRPAYYDTVLTTRNVRDAESGAMLDILLQNRVYDMAIYYTELGLSQVFKNCVERNSDAFASSFKGASKNFDKAVSRILKRIERG